MGLIFNWDCVEPNVDKTGVNILKQSNWVPSIFLVSQPQL